MIQVKKSNKNKKAYTLVGNWKMNPQSFIEAKKLLSGIDKQALLASRVTTVVTPPYVFLGRLSPKAVELGAQDLFYEEKGSFTGNISASMLVDSGTQYVIVGHSEKRKQGDTNQVVNKKMHSALDAGLTPIVCIGEEMRNDDGHHLDFLRDQVKETFAGISKKDFEKIYIAYEPVWAIGAASAMSSRDLHETNLFLKKVIRESWKGVDTNSVKILYGGSVDTLNTAELVSNGEVDGLLVGRQSLSSESFGEIISILNGL